MATMATILVAALVLFLGLGFVQTDGDAIDRAPTESTVTAPVELPETTTTTNEEPEPRSFDNLATIFRFLGRGFSTYEQTLFTDLENTKAQIFRPNARLVKSCFNYKKVPIFVRDCTELSEKQDTQIVNEYYNETNFRDLFDPMVALHRPLSYAETLNFTSFYSRVYTDALYHVNRLVVNFVDYGILKQHLTGTFKKDIKALPKNLKNENKAKYDDFINKYGTHYLSQATVGGKLRIEGLTKEEEFTFEGEKEASKIVRATMMQLLEKNGGMHVPDEWVDATWKRVSVQGGNEKIKIQFKPQAVQWYKTVGNSDYPLVINYANFSSIYHLFELVKESDTKAKIANMKARIEHHNLKFEIRQIANGLEIALHDQNSETIKCASMETLFNYFANLVESDTLEETIKTDQYKNGRECALSALNYVVGMREYFHSNTLPGE